MVTFVHAASLIVLCLSSLLLGVFCSFPVLQALSGILSLTSRKNVCTLVWLPNDEHGDFLIS
jgi:hypothetical protein